MDSQGKESSEANATEESRKLTHGHSWVIHIAGAFEETQEEESDHGVTVSIFNVPKTLISTKQEAYAPQVVALGPYHHSNEDLFEMERYKVAFAKRTQRRFQILKFRELVDQFKHHENIIRAHYHRRLEFDGETLSWMFAIDTSFLLEYLQTYATKTATDPSLTRISSKLSHLIDYTQRKSSSHAILRDIIMLENQIPLFLIREAHGFFPYDDPDNILANILLGFCKELSPLNMTINEETFKENCFKKAHLLQLLYDLLAPTYQLAGEMEENEEKKPPEAAGCFAKTTKSISNALSCANAAPIKCMSGIFKSKNIILLIKVPWKIIKHLCPNSSTSIETLVESAENMTEEAEGSATTTVQSPLIEELTIPSVSELSEAAHIKFSPTTEGIKTINFDKSTATLYLPVINLDENSDVVLRNLVAYEASVAPEVMLLTRYTELMNGIIDSEEDVKILRESGIILNHLKSDKEVATLWNGMTKSVRTTKVPNLDNMIEGVNSYYSAQWRVKFNSSMKKYVYGSWPVLVFLAANLLIFLTAVETFCSMYSCTKILSKV